MELYQCWICNDVIFGFKTELFLLITLHKDNGIYIYNSLLTYLERFNKID